jgi:hypothetical protein
MPPSLKEGLRPESHCGGRPKSPQKENIIELSPKILVWLAKVNQRQGHAVLQLAEALRYKPEGRGFNSRWCHCNFSMT